LGKRPESRVRESRQRPCQRRDVRPSVHVALAIVLTAALLIAGPPTSSSAPSPTQALRWRFVGPYRAGGATVALGVPDAPNTFYFGGSGGGVWKTTDAGRTWHAQMQHETSAAVGALSLAPPNPPTRYACTAQV